MRLICVVLLIEALASAMVPSSSVLADTLRITGAKVYSSPGKEPRTADIHIVDGRIAGWVAEDDRRRSDPQTGFETIDATGLVAVAGFWNCHVHFTEPHWQGAADQPSEKLQGQMETMLIRYGFTTVVDTGSAPRNTFAIRRRIEEGVPGPDILMYSGNFVAKGGSPAYLEVKLPELLSPEQAKAAAGTVLDYGVDGIKIFTGSYLGEGRVAHLDLPLVHAVTDHVHDRGKLVLSHPQSRQGVVAAIEGGVDVLTHTAPSSGSWAGELAERLVAAEVGVIPTLKLWRFELERAGRASEEVEAFQKRGVDQLKAFAEAGGQVLFGTDVGYMTDYDPAEEYRKLAEAGLDVDQILAALTTAPAERFRGDRKRASKLEVGQPGDIVLLGSDPAGSPDAWVDVRYTIRGGRVIYRAPGSGSE